VLIAQLKTGDRQATERIWNKYFKRLIGLARNKLRFAPRAARDEQDIALSALDSFFRGVEANRFPRLEDRNNLWHLLVTLTVRKAYRHLKEERRHPVQHFSALAYEEGRVMEIIGREPTPQFAAQVAEEYSRRLSALDDKLRTVAELKLAGYLNAQIAAHFRVVERTVERWLGMIRRIWEETGGTR
jgi:hypothetical protein